MHSFRFLEKFLSVHRKVDCSTFKTLLQAHESFFSFADTNFQVSTVTSQSHAVSTWPPPGTQEVVSNADRPHTISTAYERGHQRPALTVYTFQNPGDNITESASQKSPAVSISSRPPLPIVNFVSCFLF